MLADDYACDPRNTDRGRLYKNQDHRHEINEGVQVVPSPRACSYCELILTPELPYSSSQVDYRTVDVTSANFLNVISGRHSAGTAPSQQLHSDENSDVLVYVTGHGGDEFLKFRDTEEMTANALALANGEMHRGGRYNRLLMM